MPLEGYSWPFDYEPFTATTFSGPEGTGSGDPLLVGVRKGGWGRGVAASS